MKNVKETEIEIGDIVAVNFNNSQYTLCSKAEVIWHPINLPLGQDAWVVKNLETEQLHYIYEPCTISLIRKGMQ